MAGQVFVCCAREDQEFVVRLTENLRRFGTPVWLDQLDIPAGADWDRAIDDALEHSDTLMIVLSPESVASVEVRAEWRAALDAKKRIIPVLHKQVGIPRQLRLFQAVDFTGRAADDEEPVQQLVRALGKGQEKRDHEWVREGARLRWDGVLEKPRAFPVLQNADFAHFLLSGCRRFRLRIEIPLQSLYWRAGFAIAPEPYIYDGITSSIIQRFFLFHFGRGHLHRYGQERLLQQTSTLHYTVYVKPELWHTEEFTWPHQAIEIAAEYVPEHNLVRVQFDAGKGEWELAASDAKHLYLLAWADKFCPFNIPMRVEFLDADTNRPRYLPE